MAKSYTSLQLQCTKIHNALNKVVPPKPDDEFEDLRREVSKHLDKLNNYLQGRVTGEGSSQTPVVETE